jgi:prophage antirepressor-like protein
MALLINRNFKFNENQLTVYGTSEKPYFIANDIAKLLGYVIPKNAIRDNVWKENKISVQEYEQQNNCVLDIVKKTTYLISEQGTYQLIFASKLETAKQFQKFVFDMLVEIRKTGSYTMKKPEANQMILMSEFDLHTQIVKFIRRFFPQAIMNASLGEYQDSDKKRIEGKMCGYTAGVCDIIIFNPNHHYNSLCLEFKNPNGKGVISDKQKKFMSDMKKNCRAKTIISDDYNYLVYEIMQYFSTVRIGCQHCDGKFKCQKTLDNHNLYFHRIKTV